MVVDDGGVQDTELALEGVLLTLTSDVSSSDCAVAATTDESVELVVVVTAEAPTKYKI